ncbi:MAG: hypothetical protein JSR17_01735 [Proteobacteria bacterium]|nr:hypothetical protein [Pseudomonadota bacterium]
MSLGSSTEQLVREADITQQELEGVKLMLRHLKMQLIPLHQELEANYVSKKELIGFVWDDEVMDDAENKRVRAARDKREKFQQLSEIYSPLQEQYEQIERLGTVLKDKFYSYQSIIKKKKAMKSFAAEVNSCCPDHLKELTNCEWELDPYSTVEKPKFRSQALTEKDALELIRLMKRVGFDNGNCEVYQTLYDYYQVSVDKKAAIDYFVKSKFQGGHSHAIDIELFNGFEPESVKLNHPKGIWNR